MSRSKSAVPAAMPELHPWGIINDENADYLAQRPVPTGFRALSADRRNAGADQWDDWLDDLTADMQGWLWPILVQGRWKGAAQKSAWRLTIADLDLMETLTLKLDERVHGQRGPAGRHSELWKAEDEAAPGATLSHYHVGFPPELEPEFKRAILAGGLSIARPVSQNLKQRFQRPRPQQTALWLRRPKLRVMASKSAITPSMISGHCIQGTLALAQVFSDLRVVMELPPTLSEGIQQFFLDTGDRRVYAGLHYPSDNVGSWYAALHLCEHVFGADGAAVRHFLWQAISMRSEVFRAMKDAVERDAKSPFAPLLEKLAQAGSPQKSRQARSVASSRKR